MTTQLKDIILSTEMMDANQISNYISLSVVAESESSKGTEIGSITINGNKTSFFASTSEAVDTNYTAFEVFPTDKVIPAGTYDGNLTEYDELPVTGHVRLDDVFAKCNNKRYTCISTKVSDNNFTYVWTESNAQTIQEMFNFTDAHPSNLFYKVDAKAGNIIHFELDDYVKKADSKIWIDWGDGKKTIFSTDGIGIEGSDIYDFSDKLNEEGSYCTKYYIKHTYTTSKKYIVKIYNACGYFYNDGAEDATVGNIVSRIFDLDLPAGNLMYLTGLAENSAKILKVIVPIGYDLSKLVRVASIITASNATQWPSNLQVVYFPSSVCAKLTNIDRLQYMFNNLTQLRSLTFKIPAGIQRLQSCFGGLTLLAGSNLMNILPVGGFQNTIPTIQQNFDANWTCSTSDVAKLGLYFWNGPIKWQGTTTNVFAKMPAEVRAEIPTTWGGTKSVTA